MHRVSRDIEGLASFLSKADASRVRSISESVRAELSGRTDEDFWLEARTKVTGEIVASSLDASGVRLAVAVEASALDREVLATAPVLRPDTRFDEVVAELGGQGYAPRIVARGDVVRACCPAHEDDPEHPSLAVRKLEDGSARLKCWDRDCPPDAVLSALGLDRLLDSVQCVERAWIRSVTFDRATGVLRTETVASTYVIKATVPGASVDELYRRFAAAESKATFFNEEVRTNPSYSVVRIGAIRATRERQAATGRVQPGGTGAIGR